MALEIPPVNSAHFDGNQIPTMMGVVGTLGTADVQGTALSIPIGADPATGAAYVYNLGPAGSVSLGDITGGTIDQITNGSIVVTAGTVTTTMGDLSGGTIDLLTTGSISNLAMLHAGTITQVGTVQNIGVVHNAGTLAGGTIAGAGVVTTVSNVTNGTIRVTAGTVAQSGAWNVTGTVANGSIAVTAGTIKNEPFPATQVQPAFFIGTSAVGTLVSAAGAGIGIYPTSITLTPLSGTLDMCLSFGLGSTTPQVVARGNFVAGGGLTKDFSYPSFYATSNSPLTYQILGGAGTASWQVNYATKGTP
jgi:hypothetical protein